MAPVQAMLLRAAMLAAVVGLAASSFISNDALRSHESTCRSLLQVKKDCPVSFESANYTIITSRCKGPLYPSSLCCPALKEFACPYSDYINDVTNNCATSMFSYVNLYGKYPPGLFANICHEGNTGLACPVGVKQIQPAPPSSGQKRAAVAVPAIFMSGIALSMLLS